MSHDDARDARPPADEKAGALIELAGRGGHSDAGGSCLEGGAWGALGGWAASHVPNRDGQVGSGQGELGLVK